MPAVVQHSLAPGRHLLPRLPPGPGRATAQPYRPLGREPLSWQALGLRVV